MGQFSNYPVASTSDYANATTFLIQNADGEIKLADLGTLNSAYGCNIQCASLSIASADVLTLNSVPLEIVAAPGAGYAIEVISASVKIDFNTTPYSTNTTLYLVTNGANAPQRAGTSYLSVSAARILPFNLGVSLNSVILENAALNVFVLSGDPTAGDSDIEVFALYRVLDV